MDYALIVDNIVTNIIWLLPQNAEEFPNAIPLNDIPVGIGDSYENGVFYREGKQVLTPMEETKVFYETQLAEQEKQIQTLSDFAVAMAHKE